MNPEFLTLLCGLSLVTTFFATAEEPKETDARVQAVGGKWGLEQATITDPSLPRVLLIGDSILIGYKVSKDGVHPTPDGAPSSPSLSRRRLAH